jgi:hypothetical protein
VNNRVKAPETLDFRRILTIMERDSKARKIDVSETPEAKKRADADLLEFVIRWAWRDSPITDTERLSAIKYHPTLRRRAIEAGYVEAEGVEDVQVVLEGDLVGNWYEGIR